MAYLNKQKKNIATEMAVLQEYLMCKRSLNELLVGRYDMNRNSVNWIMLTILVDEIEMVNKIMIDYICMNFIPQQHVQQRSVNLNLNWIWFNE